MSVLLCPIYDLGAPAPGAPTVLADIEIDDFTSPSFSIANDGFMYQPGGSLGPWLAPQVGMDLYEVEATPTTTARPNNGTFNTWLDLAQSWTWYFSLTTLQARQYSLGIMPSKTATFRIDIRRKSDLVIVTTFNVTLVQMGNS